MNEPEQIVDLIARETKILLWNHWPDINEFRDGDEKIKVSFSHYINYQGQKRMIESTISFGKRMKDTAINQFEVNQMNLGLTEDSAEPEKSQKRRGRPPGKRNILAAALRNATPPDLNPDQPA